MNKLLEYIIDNGYEMRIHTPDHTEALEFMIIKDGLHKITERVTFPDATDNQYMDGFSGWFISRANDFFRYK